MPGKPWTPNEDTLLGTDLDHRIARRLRRTVHAVRARRRSLSIPPAATGTVPHDWTRRELALLGTASDAAVADQIGLSRRTVISKRQELGIPPAFPKHRGG
jgi:hypothetical protein